MRKHYHVCVGMEGSYLPNSVEIYLTLAEAREAARFAVETVKNETIDNLLIRQLPGSHSPLVWSIRDKARAKDPTHLSTLVEIVECSDGPCIEEIAEEVA